MVRRASRIARASGVIAGFALLSGCASDPNEPGTETWYINRIQEIESAKATGQISQGEYLRLKNQADATRSQRINAQRYDNTDDFFAPW